MVQQSPDRAALEPLVEGYFAAWNEADPVRRATLLNEVWAADAAYSDPNIRTVGRSPLADYIGQVLARFPGSTVVRTSVLDAHHNVMRFTWARVGASGQTISEGVDFGEIADGRLRCIIGFTGPLTPHRRR